MQKRIFFIAALLLANAVQADSTPAKKDMIAKILKIQQPAIEAIARNLAELPAAQLSQQAGMALQARVAPDRREAVAKEIQSDLKKYLDETTPLIRDRAVKLGPSTVGVVLDEKFSEDELKQLLAIMESPVNRKFQQLGAEMQKALGEKLLGETRSLVEPRAKALEQTIAKRLGIQNGGAAGAASAPVKPAAK